MPCAAGELCLVPALTSERPDGHECRGKCGGRLHGLCGEADPDCDNPMQRVCHDCLTAKQSSKDVAGKRKAAKPQAGKRKASDPGGVGAGSWKSAKSGTEKSKKKQDKSVPRTRLSNAEKVEILELLGRKVSHVVIADRYGCGPRTVSRIAENKVSITKLVASASTKTSSCKSNRSAGFPEVDTFVLDLFEKAREGKIPVTRAVIQSFGRSAKATLLDAPATSADLKEKLSAFKAGETWTKNFVKRNGLNSKVLHGEAGSANHERIAEEMKVIREECRNYRKENIFNVDETGIQYKVMPQRTYLSCREDRKTARGTKDMHYKDRLSAFMCTNADGTAKVEMAIIGKAKNPRCFKIAPCPLKYFSQANAWSDSITFRKWWKEVFLPFIRRWTTLPVLLLMDGCSSHEDLDDSKGQVKVVTYPPNCTSVHQPMDMGITAATKLNYRRELLDMKVSTMEVAATLRAQAKQRKMAAGTAGLAEGNHPHVRDAAELLKAAWGGVSAATIARCWVKGKTLPLEMEADHTATHGKVGQGGGSEVAALAGALNKLSMRVHQAEKEGSPVTDKEMIDVLANLDITPGLPAGEEAIEAAEVWATVEDQEDIVEAMRLDAVDEMTETLKGTYVNEVNVEKIEDSDDDTTGCGGGAPPPYVELSPHFVSLESAAKACGNGDASFYLQKARMSFIKAHASKPVQQADMRQFCEPQQGQGGGTAEDCSALQYCS